MALGADLTTRLLGAIETDSLLFLCGAGLSLSPPSCLLTAKAVSQRCYDAWQPTEALDPTLRDDINRLAGHFHAKGDLERVFLRLVPWNDLVGTPNCGHAAVADLLICRGACAALSANFDALIECWAEEHKVAMQGALTGHEAVEFGNVSSPLLKIHGCLRRGRDETLWTEGQLEEARVKERIASCLEWIELNLPGKNLVVVGFWTDWRYLNRVMANALTTTSASSVTVLDIDTAGNLEAKAPELWRTLNQLSRKFEHRQVSGAEALDELRTAYSRVWARKFYALGQPFMREAGKNAPVTANPDELDGRDLYNLRRDGEGVPYTRAATLRAPDRGAGQAAYARMLLLDAGGHHDGSWIELRGRLIRVVNGAGRQLAEMREGYREPPSIPQADLVICAGAIDLGVPGRLIPAGYGASVVRPAPGGEANWMTLEEAHAELSI